MVNRKSDRLLHAIVYGFLILLGAFFGVLAFIDGARAHTAASGWEYDQDCCSNHDCRQISRVTSDGDLESEVHRDGDHWVWTSSKTGNVYRIHAASPNIRLSGDGFHHGCEVPVPMDLLGEDRGAPMHDARCLYIPALF